MKAPRTLGKDEKYNPDDGMIQEADGGGFCLLILVVFAFFVVSLILSASL